MAWREVCCGYFLAVQELIYTFISIHPGVPQSHQVLTYREDTHVHHATQLLDVCPRSKRACRFAGVYRLVSLLCIAISKEEILST